MAKPNFTPCTRLLRLSDHIVIRSRRGTVIASIPSLHTVVGYSTLLDNMRWGRGSRKSNLLHNWFLQNYYGGDHPKLISHEPLLDGKSVPARHVRIRSSYMEEDRHFAVVWQFFGRPGMC